MFQIGQYLGERKFENHAAATIYRRISHSPTEHTAETVKSKRAKD